MSRMIAFVKRQWRDMCAAIADDMSNPRVRKYRFISLGIGMGIVGLLMLLFAEAQDTSSLAYRPESMSEDLRMNRRGDIVHAPSIAMIDIDDFSIKTLGRWPWPRERHGQLVHALREMGAASAVFDVEFFSPQEPEVNKKVFNEGKMREQFGPYFERVRAFMEEMAVTPDPNYRIRLERFARQLQAEQLDGRVKQTLVEQSDFEKLIYRLPAEIAKDNDLLFAQDIAFAVGEGPGGDGLPAARQGGNTDIVLPFHFDVTQSIPLMAVAPNVEEDKRPGPASVSSYEIMEEALYENPLLSVDDVVRVILDRIGGNEEFNRNIKTKALTEDESTPEGYYRKNIVEYNFSTARKEQILKRSLDELSKKLQELQRDAARPQDIEIDQIPLRVEDIFPIGDGNAQVTPDSPLGRIMGEEFERARAILRLMHQYRFQGEIHGDTSQFRHTGKVEPAIDFLLKEANSAAFVSIDPDGDGILRRAHLLWFRCHDPVGHDKSANAGKADAHAGDTPFLQVAFRAVLLFLGVPDQNVSVHAGEYVAIKDGYWPVYETVHGRTESQGARHREVRREKIDEVRIPIDEFSRLTVNWVGRTNEEWTFHGDHVNFGQFTEYMDLEKNITQQLFKLYAGSKLLKDSYRGALHTLPRLSESLLNEAAPGEYRDDFAEELGAETCRFDEFFKPLIEAATKGQAEKVREDFERLDRALALIFSRSYLDKASYVYFVAAEDGEDDQVVTSWPQLRAQAREGRDLATLAAALSAFAQLDEDMLADEEDDPYLQYGQPLMALALESLSAESIKSRDHALAVIEAALDDPQEAVLTPAFDEIEASWRTLFSRRSLEIAGFYRIRDALLDTARLRADLVGWLDKLRPVLFEQITSAESGRDGLDGATRQARDMIAQLPQGYQTSFAQTLAALDLKRAALEKAQAALAQGQTAGAGTDWGALFKAYFGAVNELQGATYTLEGEITALLDDGSLPAEHKAQVEAALSPLIKARTTFPDLLAAANAYYSEYETVAAGRLVIDDMKKRRRQIFDTVKPLVEGRICFVGATFTGGTDLKPTPLHPRFPGVGLHTNVANTILTRQFLDSVRPNWLNFVAILLIGGAIVLIASFFSVLVSGLSLVGIFTLYAVFNTQLYNSGTILTMGMPFVAVILCFAAISAYRQMSEEKAKREMQNMFGAYVSPEVVKELSRNPAGPKLGGERRDMSVMFSDVSGFTTISEALTPEALVELLNLYLGKMTDIIMDTHGSVDKYEGDAIMAFWGAPLDDADHAYHACQNTLRNLEALWRLNEEELVEKGLPLLDCRIGLNSGPMVAGNMGSSKKLNYTVMGDAVNQSARFEPACKLFDVRIQTSEETVRRVNGPYPTWFDPETGVPRTHENFAGIEIERDDKGHAVRYNMSADGPPVLNFAVNPHPKFQPRAIFRPLSRLQVKGKLIPIKTFEIMCMAETGYRPRLKDGTILQLTVEETTELCRVWQDAIEFYWDGDQHVKDRPAQIKHFQEAEQRFRAILEKWPHDGPASKYVKLCEYWLEEALPDPWGGVHVQTEK